MKMPEPVGYVGEISECATLLIEKPFWAAIPLYDKQALIDLLEAAAVECMKQDGTHDAIYAAAIRSMKEKL